jgi:hypothetical protein
MRATTKRQIVVVIVEGVQEVEVVVEEAVVVEVEEVTITEERGEIEAIVETVIVIETEIEIVTVIGTVTEKGGMIGKFLVIAAITAARHNRRTSHLNSSHLHLIAITQPQVCSHPVTCNLHPWVVHQTTCGEA